MKESQNQEVKIKKNAKGEGDVFERKKVKIKNAKSEGDVFEKKKSKIKNAKSVKSVLIVCV